LKNIQLSENLWSTYCNQDAVELVAVEKNKANKLSRQLDN